MERILRSNKGYSFAEVMIAMVIMGIVALLMGTILTTSTKMHRSSFSSDDAYAIAREKLAEFQNEGIAVTEGNTTDPENPIHRNNIDYLRSWNITQDATDPTAPVKAVISVQWNLGTSSKSISITGYIESELCPSGFNNHPPTNVSISNSTLGKDQPMNTLVGVLQATDVDIATKGDLMSFEFVTGSGSTHNSKFRIEKGKLYTNENNLAVGNYEVRIEVEDCAGATHVNKIDIVVQDALTAPQIITTSLGPIEENSGTGTSVGQIEATGGSVTFSEGTPASGNFEVSSSGLVTVQSSADLDYETAPSHQVSFTVTANNGVSPDDVQTITVNLTDLNDEAPSDITLSQNEISKVHNDEAVIGDLATVDADAIGSHSYRILSGTGFSYFKIGAAQQILTNQANVPVSTSPDYYTLEIETDDGENAVFTKTFNIYVKNQNPTDIALSNSSINEGVTFVGNLTATDPDDASGHTFSLEATGDYSKFSIAGNSLNNDGTLNSSGSPYSIDITVDDGDGGTRTESFSIIVSSTNNAPTNITLTNSSIAEGVPDGTTIGTLTPTDPDGGDAHTFSIVGGGSHISDFEIVGNLLKVKISSNITAVGSPYQLDIKVVDNGSPVKSFTKTFYIAVSGGSISGTFTHEYSVGASEAGYDHSSKPYGIGAYGATGGGWHMYTKTTSSDVSGNISSIDFSFNSVVWASSTPSSTVSIKVLGASGTPSAGDATVHSFTPTSGSSTISTTWSGSDLAKYFNGTSGYGIYFDCNYSYQSYWFAFSSITVTLN